MIPSRQERSDPSFLLRAVMLMATLRPHLLIPAWMSAATGAAWSVSKPGVASSSEFLTSDNTLAICGILVGWSLILLAINGINMAVDEQSDMVNQKNLFWRNYLGTGDLYIGSATCAIGGLALIGLVQSHFLIPGSITLFLGLLYSLPPVRLSARWGWDLLANVLGYGVVAPWIGAMLATGLRSENVSLQPFLVQTSPAAFIWLMPIVGAAFLWTTILDYDGDLKTGKQTWAVRWGNRATARAALSFFLIWLAAVPYFCPLKESLGPGGEPVFVALLAVMTVVASLTVLKQKGKHLRIRLIVAIMAFCLLAGIPGLYKWPAAIVTMLIPAVLFYLLNWLADRFSNRLSNRSINRKINRVSSD